MLRCYVHVLFDSGIMVIDSLFCLALLKDSTIKTGDTICFAPVDMQIVMLSYLNKSSIQPLRLMLSCVHLC